jgi:serine/threonine protein kinase
MRDRVHVPKVAPPPALPAGTPAYMAPELLSGGAYCAKVDMYAAGVLINEMLTHQVGWLLLLLLLLLPMLMQLLMLPAWHMVG